MCCSCGVVCNGTGCVLIRPECVHVGIWLCMVGLNCFCIVVRRVYLGNQVTLWWGLWCVLRCLYEGIGVCMLLLDVYDTTEGLGGGKVCLISGD